MPVDYMEYWRNFLDEKKDLRKQNYSKHQTKSKSNAKKESLKASTMNSLSSNVNIQPQASKSNKQYHAIKSNVTSDEVASKRTK